MKALNGYIAPSEFRRSDWDFTDRTSVTVGVLLRQLSSARDPTERSSIAEGLIRYVSGFRADEVDWERVNTGLKAAGLDPLAHTASPGRKRPLSEMHPANLEALGRADRFYRTEMPLAAHGQAPTTRNRMAQVADLVRSTVGDQMSAEEFADAMTLLNRARYEGANVGRSN